MSDVSGRSPAFWDSPAYQALISENTRLRWQVPAYRAILTDLIADLRDYAVYYSAEPLAEAADRAEDRLREVQGE